jgi:hypothetical protein
MKSISIKFLAALVIFVLLMLWLDKEEPLGSAIVSNPSLPCLGSGHLITEGLVYSIERTAVCEKEEYRILLSKSEPDVRVWSKEKEILVAPMGSLVELVNGEILITPR